MTKLKTKPTIEELTQRIYARKAKDLRDHYSIIKFKGVTKKRVERDDREIREISLLEAKQLFYFKDKELWDNFNFQVCKGKN